MKFPVVLLDGEELQLALDATMILAELVSVVDRVIVKDGQRIRCVEAAGKSLFNSDGFHRLCGEFDELSLSSEAIPQQSQLKLAVVTLSIGEKYESMRAVSEPTFKAYADRIGADYICIDKPLWNMARPHFEKWQMFSLLFIYDRILFLDGDMLVTPDCPDLFAMLPYDRLAGFYEDEIADRQSMIMGSQKELGDIGWRKDYLNSGMGVYSWIHRPLFHKARGKYVIAPAGEQSEYNYRIVKGDYKTCRLPYCFNHMDMCGTSFAGSYIIHYAGQGFMGNVPPESLYETKVETMKEDWKALGARSYLPFKPPSMMLLEGELQSQLRLFDSSGSAQKRLEVGEDCEPLTLLPITIKELCDGVIVETAPLGDILFTLPVAKETGMRLYVPKTFIGDLVYGLLDDGLEVTRELTSQTEVCYMVSQLLGEKSAVFHVRKWGSPSLAEGFGRINVTESIGAALGVRIKDPQFRLKRPAAEISGRVIIFPTGSTPQRSLTKAYTESIADYLKFKGFEVLLGDQHFDDPAAYAEFVASAEYVISVATGPQHLAAGMGIKTIGLCVASSDWGYCAKGPHVKLLKPSCSDCWYQNATEWLCGEELPLCMRENNAMNIFMAMKDLTSQLEALGKKI
jgi:hypothetical protein